VRAPAAASKITGVVLAAGAGARMGTPKAQIEVDGVRLLDRAIDLLRAGGCTEIVAVLRADDELDHVNVVVNPDPDRGMGSSLRLGLAAATGELAVITLVDTPGIAAAAVEAVAKAVLDGASVAIASYGGRRGHPVAFERTVWASVAELADGDQGARSFLRAHPELVVEVPVEGDPVDIDTPEDLSRWQSTRSGATATE
jgi:CTP:molybdopterin cytidylyltransferase MocA